MKRGLAICLMMLGNYALIAANMRLVARGSYAGTALTDALIAFVGWQLVKWIAAADTWTDRAFYILGAMLGGMLGIRLT
jgi:hypothetical protein